MGLSDAWLDFQLICAMVWGLDEIRDRTGWGTDHVAIFGGGHTHLVAK